MVSRYRVKTLPRQLSLARMMSTLAMGACILLGGTVAVSAHGLGIFVAVKCSVVEVEAKYTNGKVARTGTITILDDRNTVLREVPIDKDGKTAFSLDSAATGLRIVVDTGSHSDYWIVTADDVRKSCS